MTGNCVAHALPASLRPLGAVWRLGQMGSRQKRGRVWRGESCSVHVCAPPLPIRAFNMPSRDPLLRTAHTSLGCQDNGQQARALTPHFLRSELSNHDRCRQCHHCRYHFLSTHHRERRAIRGHWKVHQCQHLAPSFVLFYQLVLKLIADLDAWVYNSSKDHYVPPPIFQKTNGVSVYKT